jgi:hypothetical protein
MNYFLDTEFLEGTQKTFLGISKPTIDLISIGLVCENGNKYYAISKDFNLKEAWNRYDLKVNKDYKPSFGGGLDGHYNPKFIREYWIRENVLKPIYDELFMKIVSDDNMLTGDEYVYFTYSNFKTLIKRYGKTNKQIGTEIKDFIYKTTTNLSFQSTKNQIKYWGKEVPIKFYGYYADYDWVVFCWLFGKMIDLPKGFPKYCIDLKQELDRRFPNGKYGTTVVIPKLVNGTLLAELSPKTEYKEINIKEHPNYPKQNNEHNALSDAKWNFELFQFLQDVS